MNKVEKSVEWFIFNSRWLQAPIFIGLIAAQLLYSWHFVKEIIHLYMISATLTESHFMLSILGLIDVMMVANLITMVIIGGWTTFVSRLELDDNPDKPRWLGHIDPGTLKTKLAGALIGISGIHLLQTFTKLGDPDISIEQHQVMWQVIIHVTFVFSTVILAWSDLLVQKKISMDKHE